MATLNGLIKFGYAIVIVTMLLMVWASYVGAREIDHINHPPCSFNPLCSCSKAEPDLGIVRCQDVPLPRIPLHLNTSKVFKLQLTNNGLKWFEPYFLQATGLYRLEITDNPLEDIPEEAFVGLERTLWELYLVRDFLSEVPTRALKHLQKLRVLDLTGNKITEFDPSHWRGLENSLHTLILAENSITRLPPSAFTGLPYLDTIDLRGNHLSVIEPDVFREGLGHLSRILLGDNQLSQIPYIALAPLKYLRFLDLSRNQITGMISNEELPYRDKLPILSLDTLRLDFNKITMLSTASFQNFNILNNTFLDGNPIQIVEESAFRNAKIRELSLRNCRLSHIEPAAFEGLEASLQVLDLSGNNLTTVSREILHRFDLLYSLSLRDNLILNLNPLEVFTGFQFTLMNLDLSGKENLPISLQDLRRIRNLRSLTMTRLPQSHLLPEDFIEFSMNLEELRIIGGHLKAVKNHAFAHVQGLKLLDLSDNDIQTLETHCFSEIGHSLTILNLAHGLSSSFHNLPWEAIRPLTNLEDLNLGNNYIRYMPDTSFHFLTRLRRLELQDNKIEQVHKGTFQGDIHSRLEDIFLSFNEIRSIQQHTFVDLGSLSSLYLDDNNINTIGRRAFMNLDRLELITLRGNKIESIADEAFQNLPQLEYLDLAFNKLRHFEFGILDQVGTLSSFRVNVSYNLISELRTNVTTFNMGLGSNLHFLGMGLHANIKVLDLSYNNISHIGRSFFRPAEISLTHLHLSRNFISNVTRDVFGNMPHLQWLDLSYNYIDQVDFDAFRNSRRLQVVLLSHNNIEIVNHETFQYLMGLRIVDLSYNNLRNLPDHLFQNDAMEILDLSHNYFSKMPLTSLSHGASATLCELDLSWNNIGSLAHPELLSRFRSLIRLDLSNNRILRIDEAGFAALPRLLYLDLSHNSNLDLADEGYSFRGLENSLLKLELNNVSLTSVPELPLQKLRYLSIASNELPTVPPELAANMSSLRQLDLSNNDLTAVPIVTHSLPHLRSLSLAGNPITALTNTSLLGVADQLETLDLRHLALINLETGTFGKMHSLRTLHISIVRSLRNLHFPTLLKYNGGLRNLHIEVEEETNLSNEMNGDLPSKLRNISLSGHNLLHLSDNILNGVKSPELNIALVDTRISKLNRNFFEHVGNARNVTLDARNAIGLQHIENPSTGFRPGLSRKTYLTDLEITGNAFKCDCLIGWVEVWERKRRQYICNAGSKLQELNCRQASDGLRKVACGNRNNNTLLEILKTEIECGWGSVGAFQAITAPVLIALATLLRVF